MTNSDDPRKKASNGPPQITDMILGSLKARTGKETSKWIAGLADDSALKEAAEVAAKDHEAAAATAVGLQQKAGQQTVISFMDHLFDCFQQYEFDFNRSVAGTDLVITIDRPLMAHENIKQQFVTESVQVFRGRISTRSWTFLLRGRQECIEGWILPIEKMISFTADQSAFSRYLYIRTDTKNGALKFNVDGMEIPWENIRSLAKMLFGSLIRVAKGEASETETFSLRTAKQPSEKTMPPTTMAQLAAQAQAQAQAGGQNYSFNEHNPAFESPFAKAQTAGNPRPQQNVPPQNGGQGGHAQGFPAESQPLGQPNVPPNGSAGSPHQMAAGPNPMSVPANPMVAQSNPMAAPANPMAAPANPMAAPPNPFAVPSNPMAPPPNPIAVPPNPMAGPQNAMAAPQNAMTVGQNPMTGGAGASGASPSPVAVPPNPLAAPPGAMPTPFNPMSALPSPMPAAAFSQPGLPPQQIVPANPMAPAAPTFSGPASGPQQQPIAQNQLSNQHHIPAGAQHQNASAFDDLSIDGAFDLLNRVVFREMTKMSAAGAEAFTKQDMAAIEQAFKRTTKLKQLNEEIGRTVETWKATLKEVVEN